MRRRSSQIDPKDRSHVRFQGNRNPDNHFSAAKSPRKTEALNKDSPPNCNFTAASVPSERRKHTTHADAEAKTSEYAFFKKLRESAGQRLHSRPLQKEPYLSKKLKTSDCSREHSNNARVHSKDFSSSTLVQDVPSIKFDSFSPPAGALKESDWYPISSTQKHLQGYGQIFQPEGLLSNEENQYVCGEIFFRKRQKLRRWAADTSIPDIDKLCSEGHDIVSMLLSRLFPKSNKENKFKDPNPEKVVTATRYDLLASQESDIQFKEDYHMPKRKFLELESTSYVSDHMSSPKFDGSDERIIAYTDFPVKLSDKFPALYSITEPESTFGRIPNLSAKRDVNRGFMFDELEHESITGDDFKELGKLGREPYPLLLEKDFDSATDEMVLPISYRNARPYNAPGLLIPLSNNEEQKLNNMSDEYGFSSSSLLPNRQQDFNSMLDSGLLRYQEYRFGKYVYEDKENMDIDFNFAPSSLSYNMDYLKLSEDCKNEISCVRDSLNLSPCQHWLRRPRSRDNLLDPDTEACLSSPFNFISKQRWLSFTGSISSHQDLNHSMLQFPPSKSISTQFENENKYERDLDADTQGEMIYQFRKDMIEIYSSSFFHATMHRENGLPLQLHRSDYIREQEQTHKMLL